MTVTREWFSAADLVEMNLPSVPTTKPSILAMADRLNWRRPDKLNRWWRVREGRGGGFEYHYSVLPPKARAAWLHLHTEVDAGKEQAAATAAETRNQARWDWFRERPQKVKAEAERRLRALLEVRKLTDDGVCRVDAILDVCADHGIERATFYNWEKLVQTVPRHDWLPFLAPNHKGSKQNAECSPEAWEYFKARYLRLSRPTYEYSYRELQRDGKPQGWTIPSLRTLIRWIEKLDPRVVTLKREGERALERMYPAQQRDRNVFHAMQAVNADGHKIDLFCRWHDGKTGIGRVILVSFQDLYSGKILSWRVGRSETSEMVRLAYGEMGEKWGIPEIAYFDNGRAFASKENTGGAPTRFRHKVKDEDPEGVLVACGTKVVFVIPEHGQSKPIERAFGIGNLSETICKDLRCVGAWTGNNPMAKPEDYGTKAVPIDVLLAVISEAIAEYNDRPGRHTDACQGKLSFNQAFEASYRTVTVPKLSEAQRSIWWLATEGLKVRTPDATLHFWGNRYWAEFLTPHMGEAVTVRFDPDQLHAGLHVFGKNGQFLGLAPCIEKVGFNDREAGKDQRRRIARNKREAKALAAQHIAYSDADLIGFRAPAAPEAEPPQSKLVRLVARGNLAVAPREITAEEDDDPRQSAFFASLRQVREARPGPSHLRAVTNLDGD